MANFKFLVSRATPDTGVAFATAKAVDSWGGLAPVLGKFKTRRDAVAFGRAYLGYGWTVYKARKGFGRLVHDEPL